MDVRREALKTKASYGMYLPLILKGFDILRTGYLSDREHVGSFFLSIALRHYYTRCTAKCNHVDEGKGLASRGLVSHSTVQMRIMMLSWWRLCGGCGHQHREEASLFRRGTESLSRMYKEPTDDVNIHISKI